jgi:DNA-directed RNA polymerase specialized sigma24 family protein
METHAATLFIGGLEGRRLERWLTSLLRRWGVRREERDDILQETYCRWLEHAPARRRDGSKAMDDAAERVYLARVARSAVVDAVRARNTQKRGGELTLRFSEAGAEAARWIRDPSPDAEETLIRRERRAALLRACASGCRRRRHRRRELMVARLAWIDGYSSREISGLSGGRLRAAGIDSMLTRYRRRLRAAGIALPERRPAEAP